MGCPVLIALGGAAELSTNRIGNSSRVGLTWIWVSRRMKFVGRSRCHPTKCCSLFVLSSLTHPDLHISSYIQRSNPRWFAPFAFNLFAFLCLARVSGHRPAAPALSRRSPRPTQSSGFDAQQRRNES
ncbi:hypothetical protein BHM03_00020356 [Ensete ventricosum]|nr:hypothetical protein BHM03_00020356 [Ensete ventricosum]